MATINENLSIYMYVLGRQAGTRGWPGSWGRLSLLEISDISTSSRSGIFFTTLGSKEAGLNGPWP